MDADLPVVGDPVAVHDICLRSIDIYSAVFVSHDLIFVNYLNC